MIVNFPHKAVETQEEITKRLILAAQNKDDKALEELCRSYESLFRKEAKREIFYNSLGYEDALSIARTAFIEIVMSYNGSDYFHFPGYVQCRVHYALFDAMRKRSTSLSQEVSLDVKTADDDGDAQSSVVLPYHEDYERILLALLLRAALRKLTRKQQDTINEIYFKNHSIKETAKNMHCSSAMVTKHHAAALKNLRRELRVA